MKKIAFIFSLLTLIFNAKSLGQTTERKTTYLDLALAGSFSSTTITNNPGKSFSAALSYNKLFSVVKSNKFKIGYSIRATYFNRSNMEVSTAPARLTAGKSSLLALLESEKLTYNIDTLLLGNTSTAAFNIGIKLNYQINKKIDLGFDIDAIGFTIGSTNDGQLIGKNGTPHSGRKFNNNTLNSQAKPTSFNLLLISDSDIGSLNSELYARYALNDKIGIRGGVSFNFVEYTTENNVNYKTSNETNNRWRYKSLLPMLAVSYKL